MKGNRDPRTLNPKPSLKKSKFSKKIEIPNLSFNDIPCPKHPNRFVTSVCTSIFCQIDQMFLCDYCMDSHRSERNFQSMDLEKDYIESQHIIENMDNFVQRCLTFFPDVIEKERRNKAAICKDMIKFQKKSGKHFLQFVECVSAEKKKIESDFNSLRKKAQVILDQLEKSKKTMINSLNESLRNVKNSLEKLKQAPSQSELFKQSESSQLLSELLNLHGQKDINYKLLNETFIKVRKIFNNRNICFDHDEKLSPNKIKELRELVQQIRMNIANPPRYKIYKNSEQEYATIELAIETLANSLQNVDRRLLIEREFLSKKKGPNELEKDVVNNTGELLVLRDLDDFELKKKKIEIISTLKTEHSKGITSMCYFEKDKLITGSWDNTIQVYDISNFTCIKTLLCEKTPYSLATCINKKTNKSHIVSGHIEGYLMVINDNFIVKHTFHQHKSLISSLVTLDNGRTVISGGFDSKIVIYDIIEGVTLRNLSAHEEAVNCLEFLGGNKSWIISGSDDCSVRIWHLNFLEKSNPEQIEPYIGLEEWKKSTSKTFSQKDNDMTPDSSLERQNTSFDSRAAFSEVWRRTWDGRTYQKTSFVKKLEHSGPVRAIKTLKINQRILLTAEFNSILIWDIETGSCLKKLSKHDNQIYKLGVIEMNGKGIASNVSSFKSCSELMSEILNNLESPKDKSKPRKDKNIPEVSEEEEKEINYNREKKRSCSAVMNSYGRVKKISALLLVLESPFYIISFGEDHCIKLWDIRNDKWIAETPDKLKEFTNQWRYGSALFIQNDFDKSVHFLNVGDRDNSINIWRLR